LAGEEQNVFSRRQLRTLLFFWIAALVIGSFLPPQAKQWLGTRSPHGAYASPSRAHRCWHIAAFGSAALLASAIAPMRRAVVLHAAGLIALGATIECLQRLIYAADLEWWDIRDNGYGIVAFSLFGQLRIVRQMLRKDEL
jgi:hypothetical protein